MREGRWEVKWITESAPSAGESPRLTALAVTADVNTTRGQLLRRVTPGCWPLGHPTRDSDVCTRDAASLPPRLIAASLTGSASSRNRSCMEKAPPPMSERRGRACTSIGHLEGWRELRKIGDSASVSTERRGGQRSVTRCNNLRVNGLAGHRCFEVAFGLDQFIGAGQGMARRPSNVPREPWRAAGVHNAL
jgi:hypothetical protein